MVEGKIIFQKEERPAATFRSDGKVVVSGEKAPWSEYEIRLWLLTVLKVIIYHVNNKEVSENKKN